LRETFLNLPAENPNNNIDSKDLKLLKDLQRRFGEIEKNFKTFSASINVELINKDIRDLNEAVSNKLEKSTQQIINLAESFSKK